MQNLKNMGVFDILITQKLLKCPKDPFVRSALNYFSYFSTKTYVVGAQKTISIKQVIWYPKTHVQTDA